MIVAFAARGAIPCGSSSMCIQGRRSCLANGGPLEIPSMRDEAVRKQCETDNWSPFPEDRRPGQPLPSIRGDVAPSDVAVAAAKEVWEGMGYGKG